MEAAREAAAAERAAGERRIAEAVAAALAAERSTKQVIFSPFPSPVEEVLPALASAATASSARPVPHAHTAACNHDEGPEKTLIAAAMAGNEAGVNAALSRGESTHQKDEVRTSTVAYACIQ